MLDQETGLRGYVLSGEDSFLEPFHTGRRDADAALATLHTQLKYDSVKPFRPQIEAIEQSTRAWEHDYADPTIAAVGSNPGGPRSVAAGAGGQGELRPLPRRPSTA